MYYYYLSLRMYMVSSLRVVQSYTSRGLSGKMVSLWVTTSVWLVKMSCSLHCLVGEHRYDVSVLFYLCHAVYWICYLFMSLMMNIYFYRGVSAGIVSQPESMDDARSVGSSLGRSSHSSHSRHSSSRHSQHTRNHGNSHSNGEHQKHRRYSDHRHQGQSKGQTASETKAEVASMYLDTKQNMVSTFTCSLKPVSNYCYGPTSCQACMRSGVRVPYLTWPMTFMASKESYTTVHFFIFLLCSAPPQLGFTISL